MRPSGPGLANRDGPRRVLHRDTFGVRHKAETDLAATGELHIDLRKQLSVEQRAMLYTMAAVDAEPHAQGVETMLGTGMPGSRKLQRVAHAAHAD